jgi:hypothetical protein
MVDVHLQLSIGLNGTPIQLSILRILGSQIDSTANYAGSNHILRMGSHFNTYIARSPPTLPVHAWIPSGHPYKFLDSKLRAGGVTGNIGEMMTALIATRELGLHSSRIGHIQPRTGRYKSPDYMLELNSVLPQRIMQRLPQTRRLTLPNLWPVESKAREYSSGAASAAKAALRQLVVYWWQIRNRCPQNIGYGMINTFAYLQLNHPLTLIILLPHPRHRIRSILNRHNYPQLLNLLKNWDHPEFVRMRGHLYGC